MNSVSILRFRLFTKFEHNTPSRGLLNLLISIIPFAFGFASFVNEMENYIKNIDAFDQLLLFIFFHFESSLQNNAPRWEKKWQV